MIDQAERIASTLQIHTTTVVSDSALSFRPKKTNEGYHGPELTTMEKVKAVGIKRVTWNIEAGAEIKNITRAAGEYTQTEQHLESGFWRTQSSARKMDHRAQSKNATSRVQTCFEVVSPPPRYEDFGSSEQSAHRCGGGPLIDMLHQGIKKLRFQALYLGPAIGAPSHSGTLCC